MKVLELFGGAGGLALGFRLAGFNSSGFIEWNKHACNTVRHNIHRGYPLVKDWNVYQEDVRAFDWSLITEDIDVITGGPPCQPFSLGGRHKGHLDERDMFPSAIEAVRRLLPKAFVFENVKGLTRQSFRLYFKYIIAQLQKPFVLKKPNEDWLHHFARIQADASSKQQHKYQVYYKVLNAADFGVAQKRMRVFFVGFRSDLDCVWSWPTTTHSKESLLFSKWISKEYWEEHKIQIDGKATESPPSLSIMRKLERMKPDKLPWRTVRDALHGLGEAHASTIHLNHVNQDGARVYPGHTGSPLDQPSKTIKAGDHGVPGGENMKVLDDQTVQYYTIREAARIQTFPDGYIISGNWGEAMRQLGNAVPVQLAFRVAQAVAMTLSLRSECPTTSTIDPRQRILEAI